MSEEKVHIPEENIYNSRGCCKAPSLNDKTRAQQMCSCAKLNVHDWTKDFPEPVSGKPFDIVEVRFKNSRKEFFRIPSDDKEHYETGDIVAVEGSPGHDIGIISLQGDLVRLQLKKRGISTDSEAIRKVFRKARQTDVDKWNEVIKREKEMQRRAREIAIELGLSMKLNDVEIQGDGTKAIFYFTAEDRVDFRQLIRQYASEFNVRVEMKQIGVRQEAGHLGGIGTCGRELCCVTCLSSFNSVVTQAARVQQIAINPYKLAGQCGKLKCCLNYEYEIYLDALTDFPDQEVKLHTKKGAASCVKIDVFERKLYYAYDDTPYKHHELKLEEVKRIIEKNKNNQSVDSLEEFSGEKKVVHEHAPDFENVVGQDDLTRFDRKKKNKNKNRNQHQQHQQQNKGTQPAGQPNTNQPKPNANQGKQQAPQGKPRTNNQKNKPRNDNKNQQTN